MTGQIVAQSPTDSYRRQPLLWPNRSPFTACVTLSPVRNMKPNVGECAGSTAAECDAICCCCPFVLVEFLFYTVYKLPTGICHRSWRKRLLRNNIKKSRLMNHQSLRDSGRRSTIHCFDNELSKIDRKISIDGSPEEFDLDEEMWERFHSKGFGRSLSQRHD